MDITPRESGVFRVPGELLPALREVLFKAAKAPLTKTDWKVLSAVLNFTAGWRKLEDEGYNAAIGDFAGVRDVRRVGQSLKKLRELGIIGYEHSRRNGQRSRYSIAAPAPDEPAVGVPSDRTSISF